MLPAPNATAETMRARYGAALAYEHAAALAADHRVGRCGRAKSSTNARYWLTVARLIKSNSERAAK